MQKPGVGERETLIVVDEEGVDMAFVEVEDGGLTHVGI